MGFDARQQFSGMMAAIDGLTKDDIPPASRRKNMTLDEYKQHMRDTVAMYAKALPEYVNAVSNMKCAVETANVLYRDDIERFQDMVSTADLSRARAHDSAQTACRVLNRLCDRLHVEHVAPDVGEIAARHGDNDPRQRAAVANFAALVTMQTGLDASVQAPPSPQDLLQRGTADDYMDRAIRRLEDIGKRTVDADRCVRILLDEPDDDDPTSDELCP